jgi:hypothetical protein
VDQLIAVKENRPPVAREIRYANDAVRERLHMTELLNIAFNEASQLPPGEQDMFAKWMLEELRTEKRWQELFARSQDMLATMADKALAEHRAGKTLPLDPDTL